MNSSAYRPITQIQEGILKSFFLFKKFLMKSKILNYSQSTEAVTRSRYLLIFSGSPYFQVLKKTNLMNYNGEQFS